MKKHIVTFYPDNKKVVVDSGATILAAANSAHIHINSSCAGEGVCGKCRVIVKGGTVTSRPSANISEGEKARGVHLACQAHVESNIEVEVPPESRLDLSVLSQEELGRRLRGIYSQAEDILMTKPHLGEDLFQYSPLVTKLYLKLPKPDSNDKVSDLDRVYRAIETIPKINTRPIHRSLANIKNLDEVVRSDDWKVTVSLYQRGTFVELVMVEAGDTSLRNYGLVFDIGTTTVTGQLIDLANKKILGTKAAYNRQAAFGADVITRIIYSQLQGGLAKLHRAVVDLINEMTEVFVDECKIDLNDITCICVAGNTTMIHLLLNLNPSYIRKDPYVPMLNSTRVLRASEVGIKLNPHGLLFCIPGVANYVGGDITAGVMSCGIHRSKNINLLIDIGTNGELVLGNSDWLIGCAASAGPAFEGSGMSCGLRAVKGAIQTAEVKANTLDVRYSSIGKEKPRGICGSGYIDLVWALLDKGVLDKNGKINRSIKNKRVREAKHGYEFVVVFAEDSAIDKDIVVTDTDLDNLKRAKAAIYSGISILIRHMDIKMKDIKKIFIAGGFGTSLNIKSAIQIGLVPDIPVNNFIFVGNSSLAGARQSLLSAQAASVSEEVAKNITYFDLSTEHDYMDEYMAALFFPHTDMKRFPSVKYHNK